MTPHVDFSIFAVTTVPSAYYADMNPIHFPNFLPITEPLTAYCPYTKIEFRNISVPVSGYYTTSYIWHFGDYYSETLTTIQSSIGFIEHIYQMPGSYTVSLNIKQTPNFYLLTEDGDYLLFEDGAFIELDESYISPTIKPINITTTKVNLITLKENAPQARIHSVTQPVYGDSPLTLEFTPVHCIPGSFPLNRIDWDFGDSSPIKIITRQTIMSADPDIYFTDTVNCDVLDVRNYNVRHTYYRTSHENQIFYPSLTCYSSNTDLFDTCSTTIGPIFGSPTDASISLLKTRNTSYGNL
jgi:hypothetical protein